MVLNSTIGKQHAGSILVLIVGCLVVGAGIGPASFIVPPRISEVALANARGWQVSLFQLAIAVGILATYVADYAFAASGNWRWMLGLTVIRGVLLVAGMPHLPETPRYLARKDVSPNSWRK